VGRRTLEDGAVEAQARRGQATLEPVALGAGAADAVAALLQQVP
jgi:hypothetical protein